MARPQSFSTSFWTPDYISGVNVLFDKLEQGVAENAQVLAFLSSRISVESAYAANLETTARDVQTGSAANAGFNRDEGASLKQAFTSILDESRIQGQEHSRIAAHLERLVRGPFAQYSGDHRQRIADAKASLIGQIRNYHKATLQVSKAQQAYFTKARQLEDFSDSTVPKIVTSPISSSPTRQQKRLSQLLPQTPPSHTSNLPPGAPANCPDVHIGSMVYPYDKFCLLLKSMTSTIPQETLRITLLGSYEHVIEGEQLVSYARKYVNLKSLVTPNDLASGWSITAFCDWLALSGAGSPDPPTPSTSGSQPPLHRKLCSTRQQSRVPPPQCRLPRARSQQLPTVPLMQRPLAG